ncbi:malate dehydrogenase 1B [Schistosoma japonicum]|nr:malate dehydrogenase 1B [Schistosoma japonicum]
MWRKSNCPFYARVELVADKLSLNLPNFRVTKIVKQPQDWKSILEDLAVVDPLPLEKFLREGQKPKENKDDEYQMQDVEEN